ncbi:metal-dependent hydrolase [Macrococcus epidermidis]|uniref:metal-dependent hydrolase n=1 Tax=Macrococcus epidermidis TaxID=1902580 RepID=UPI001EF32F66|nr:metal-dependent hydrolase [Macrococcus epidermidis]MCG7419721.1 metal-dependent hydrolase [Macrococcus epidermidis]
MEVYFHGQSCISFESNGKKVLVDPFITGNKLSDLDASTVQADYILLTHGHGDHIGDTVEIAKRTNATVVATPEIVSYLGGQGIEHAHPMNIGGKWMFDFGSVKYVQAFHSNSLYDDEGNIIYFGMPCGLIIEVEGKTIYHAGDTGLFSDMKLIAERHPVDLCFIPIGDNFTMGIDDAAYAINTFINPKLTVPIHYNTFPYIEVDPNEFKSQVKSPVEILDAGKSVTL